MPAVQSRDLLAGGIAALAAAYLLYRYRSVAAKRATLDSAAAATVSPAPAPAAPAAPVTPAAAATADTADAADTAADAKSAATTTLPFPLGSDVRLVGLQKKPALNGKRGRIIGWDEAKGRLNVALRGENKTVQLKAANLVAVTTGVERLEDMVPEDLVKLTFAKGDGLSAAHGARVTELLRSASQPVDAGSLLRCCVCCEWFVAGLQSQSNGEIHVEPFPHDTMGSGLLLCTTTERCVEMGQALPPPPKGASRVAVKLHAHKLFSQNSMEALIKDGVKFVGLDGRAAGSSSPDAGTMMTILQEAHFPALMHMSAAVSLEAALAPLRSALPSLRASPTSSSLAEQAAAFASHTFFCFNASTNPDSILPITAVHKGESYMLLYTCEMVLEAARVVLDDLGAFKAAAGGARVPSSPLPASYLMSALSPSSGNAGIHINEFVMGMADENKLVGLRTAEIETLTQAAGERSAGAVV